MSSIATLTRNLAWLYVKRRNYLDAEVYKRKEVDIRLQIAHTHGHNQSDLHSAHYGLAKILRKCGKDNESMKYYYLARKHQNNDSVIACSTARDTKTKNKQSNDHHTIFKP